MRQRWLLNLALFSVILILGALVFYTIEQEKPDELPKLTTLEADQVENIRIEQANNEPIVLIKDALGSWQITTPFELPANSFQVDKLLEILSERDYQPLKIDSMKLADFKLEPPLASVKFEQLTVAFGDTSPMGDGQRYALINDKLYLLKDSIYYSLQDALKFVNLSPLGNNPKITELKMPDYHLILTEGKWTVTSSFSAEEIDTSQDKLNALIDNWQNASAYEVKHYEPESESATKKEEASITLLGQQQPLHFLIVSTTPDLVLARSEKGVQYQLSMTQVDKLLHLPTKEPPADTTSKSENQENAENAENAENDI